MVSSETLKEQPFRHMVFTTTGLNQRKDINENQYIQHIKDLGGEYSEKFTNETKYLVVFSYAHSAKYEHVIKNCSSTVLLDYSFVYNVYNKWKNAENLDMDLELKKGMLKPFTNCRVYVEPSKTSSEITEAISNNGGTLCDSINDKINIYVWTGLYNDGISLMNKIRNDCRRNNTSYRFFFVHENWIYDSMKAYAYLNPKKYIVSVYNLSGLKVRHFNSNSSLLPKNYNEYNGSTLQKSVPLPKRKRLNDQWDELGNTSKRTKTNKQKADDVIELKSFNTTRLDSTRAPTLTKLIFDGCVFFFLGFDRKKSPILKKVVESNGGKIASKTDDDSITHLIVYSLLPLEEALDLAEWETRKVHVKTEWFIERSMEKKKCVNDVWGTFISHRNLSDFKGLDISISGFKGTELLHVERMISMLGGNYCETFNSSRDLLITLPGSTKEPYAKKWKIPVAGPEWLWESAKIGRQSPTMKLTQD